MKALILAFLFPLTAFAHPYNSYDCGAALLQSWQPLARCMGYAPETDFLRFKTRAHIRGDQVFGFTVEVAHADPGFAQYTLVVAKKSADATVEIVFSRKDMDGKPNVFGDYGVAIKNVGEKNYSWGLEGGGDILLSGYVAVPGQKEKGIVTLTCFKL